MEFNASPLIYTGLQGLFYVLLFVFVLHTLFLAYHWFTYGTSKHMSLLALALYLVGGAVLFLTFSVALQII